MIYDTIKQQLHQGIKILGIPTNDALIEALSHYLHLLEKWNKTYNLTAIRDINAMVALHILDSLSVLPHVKGTTILDIGTGAGLPSIVWGLVHPEWQLTPLDSKNKKIRFITQAVLELQLKNISPTCQRIENFTPKQKFDCIVSRAYTDLHRFYQQSRPLCKATGQILAMKGQLPLEELKKLDQAGIAYEVHILDVPQLEAKRHLIIM